MRPPAPRLQLAHEEEEHDADEEHGQQRDEGGRPEGRRVLFLEVDLELPVLGEGVILEVLDERLVGDGAEGLDLRVLSVDRVRELVLAVLDPDLRDLALVHPADELAEAHLLLALPRLKDLPDREEHHDKEDPEEQRLVGLLHFDLVSARLHL